MAGFELSQLFFLCLISILHQSDLFLKILFDASSACELFLDTSHIEILGLRDFLLESFHLSLLTGSKGLLLRLEAQFILFDALALELVLCFEGHKVSFDQLVLFGLSAGFSNSLLHLRDRVFQFNGLIFQRISLLLNYTGLDLSMLELLASLIEFELY